MPVTLTADDCFVIISTKTGLSTSELKDFLSCSPEQQKQMAKTYNDQSWVRDKDILGDVLLVLGVMANVAGGVSGVAGAIAALKAI